MEIKYKTRIDHFYDRKILFFNQFCAKDDLCYIQRIDQVVLGITDGLILVKPDAAEKYF